MCTLRNFCVYGTDIMDMYKDQATDSKTKKKSKEKLIYIKSTQPYLYGVHLKTLFLSVFCVMPTLHSPFRLSIKIKTKN